MGNEKLERVKTLTAVLTNATQLAVGGKDLDFAFIIKSGEDHSCLTQSTPDVLSELFEGTLKELLGHMARKSEEAKRN